MIITSNSGYVGQSRSVRSDKSIREHEVPLNHINKALIQEVCEELDIDYKDRYSVSFIKYYTRLNHASSWHHTGKYFNKTTHYDLTSALIELSEMKENELLEVIQGFNELQVELREERKNKQEAIELKIVEFCEEVWEGTRRRPKRVVYEHIGIQKDNWIYSLEGKKYKADAKKNYNFVYHKTLRTLDCSSDKKTKLSNLRKQLKKGMKL